MFLRLPLMSPDLNARITSPIFIAEAKDSRTNLEDIAIAPLVLGWHPRRLPAAVRA
jgi:hypothetical protein